MKKKLVATLLSFAMVASVFAACGNEAEDTQTSTSVSEQESVAETTSEASSEAASEEIVEATGLPVDYFAGTEITILVGRNDYDQSTDHNEKPAIKAAEEATGIHVNWDYSGSEAIPQILASGELSDAFLYISSSHLLQNPDMFYDLSEEGLLETYAPNVCADYEEIKGAWDAVTWSDGKILSLLTGASTSYLDMANGIYVINQDWLDQLNLSQPTNKEEFLDILRAFRDNDMNGNGDTTDEIPFSFGSNKWASNLMIFSDYWGLGNGCGGSDKLHWRQIKDGKVVGTADTDQYRDFLETMHLMVEEGLVDIEGFSQTADQFSAKVAAGRVGVYSCWTPEGDYKDDYVALNVFPGMEGTEPIIGGYGENGATYQANGFVIAADTENVEAVLHWWNYLSSSTELKWTMAYGVQGETWDVTEDGKYYEVYGDDETLKYTQGFDNLFPVFTPEECPSVNPYVTDDDNAVRAALVEEIRPYAVTEPFPKRFTTPEAEEERSFLETELMAYLGNFLATSVMDGIDDAAWEAHLQQLEDLGYYDWLAWYQKFVDNELN